MRDEDCGAARKEIEDRIAQIIPARINQTKTLLSCMTAVKLVLHMRPVTLGKTDESIWQFRGSFSQLRALIMAIIRLT